MILNNVILPLQDESKQWDIQVDGGKVSSMKPSTDVSPNPSILLPSLCHPHIHLDKPYLLTCNHSSSESHPDYSDLVPKTGSFAEALSNTAEAKKRYTPEDLYLRGSQLLATSYTQGVSSLRAFAEIDHVTKLQTLKTAVDLSKEFEGFVDLQICAFAQDPIFSTEHGDENRKVLQKALDEPYSEIEVLGTTPYVEENKEMSKKNIRWAIQMARKYGLHLDFHIEFNLNQEGDVMEYFNYIIDQLVESDWPTHTDTKTVVLGHATRLTLASNEQFAALSRRIRETELPIYFVGLPTSDVFMMGRPASDRVEEQPRPLDRQCGTLNVPKMIQEYGLNACLSVNNVGNAFTPYGTGDPLGVASLGVGLFHAGRIEDAKLLYEAVSTRAEEAIGLEAYSYVRERKPLRSMLLFKNEEDMEIQSPQGKMIKVPARPRLSIKDIVWDPPETKLRRLIP
ncbi:uncharacterized protein FIESC28_01877 [Fusarium coffeatum]|uniref:Amidohydrolase-related domain-containing protein n=1 Tax=Fusarium coffeatum TaxID=231269 RepID=A0A366S8N3_9HYPO|nr:uncharacterized protein FIESC28_01877 [Fusarium coffeatum]RBR25268.1 hypothetical protein FIESC28_01877 [Fusarium coffeatum]